MEKSYCPIWNGMPIIECRVLRQRIEIRKCVELDCGSLGRCMLVEKERIEYIPFKAKMKEIPPCLPL